MQSEDSSWPHGSSNSSSFAAESHPRSQQPSVCCPVRSPNAAAASEGEMCSASACVICPCDPRCGPDPAEAGSFQAPLLCASASEAVVATLPRRRVSACLSTRPNDRAWSGVDRSVRPVSSQPERSRPRFPLTPNPLL